MKNPLPDAEWAKRMIPWNELGDGDEIEDVRIDEAHSAFVLRRGEERVAVIIWPREEATQARTWLYERCFARCDHPGCGARVAALGEICPSHGPLAA